MSSFMTERRRAALVELRRRQTRESAERLSPAERLRQADELWALARAAGVPGAGDDSVERLRELRSRWRRLGH